MSPNIPKRNQSTTSYSAGGGDHRVNAFCTPNRFALLATEDGSTGNVLGTPQNEPSTGRPADQYDESVQSKQPFFARPPPIHIKDVTDIDSLQNELITIVGTDGFTYKTTPMYMIVYAMDRTTYNKIMKFLNESDFEFHTFRPQCLRTFQVIVRNLHWSTPPEDIVAALAEAGHQAERVTNLKKRGFSYPIFQVELKLAVNNFDVFKVRALLGTCVKVEKPHRLRQGPPQCHNCQAYGHTKTYCGHFPRCVKCGEDHHTRDCTKDLSVPAKCALCAGNHTANYKGCPAFQALFKKHAPKRRNRRNKYFYPYYQPELYRQFVLNPLPVSAMFPNYQYQYPVVYGNYYTISDQLPIQ